MIQELVSVIYPVKDLDKAKTLYSALLGTAPIADSAYYVGFRVGNLNIGLDPNGHGKSINGPVNYWQVSDIKQSLQALLEAGAVVVQDDLKISSGNANRSRF